MSSPKLMFYHDGRHPLIYMYEPPMQKEEYEAGVDELIGTPVDALMFCLGDGRTVLHDTKVGELWGHNIKKWSHAIFRRAHQNAKGLIRTGNDPLRVISERAREKGLHFYPTLLVQQGRGDREIDVRCSDFRFDNPHLEIGATGDLDPEWAGYACLDFKHQAVRDERFALIEETLKNYDVDGFELQLNYQPYYFHPKEVDRGRVLMTDWARRIHEALKKSGKNRELVIRIPASIEGCFEIGLDVHEWLKLGIVDAIIGQKFSGPELHDPGVDFNPLVEAAKGTGCRVYAALQSHLDSDRLCEASIEMIRAAACNYWSQGVDGFYLAHWFNHWPYQADFYEILRELPDPEVMAPKDKIYTVPTETGRYPNPALEPGLGMDLPRPLKAGKSVRVPITISDDLPRWNQVGRVHEILLRIRIMNTTELDRLTFKLNRKEIPADLLRKINEMYRMSAPRYRTGSGYWFVFRLDRAHWPRKGKNTLEITLDKRDAAVKPQIYVRDVELDIRYLMGKNYHRIPERDLGPRIPSGI